MEELAVRLWQDEEGQALLEYALLLFLVSLIAISSMKNLASTVGAAYSDATGDIMEYHITLQTSSDHMSGPGQGGSSSQFGWGKQGEAQNGINNNTVKEGIQ